MVKTGRLSRWHAALAPWFARSGQLALISLMAWLLTLGGSVLFNTEAIPTDSTAGLLLDWAGTL